MPKVLLDTNVFIFSIERPLSNSHVIIDMLIDGEIHVYLGRNKARANTAEAQGITPNSFSKDFQSWK